MRKIVFWTMFILMLLFVFTLQVLASPPGQTSPPEFVLTPEILAGIAGAVLSLAFSYIPGLSTKFAALPDETKQLIMAVLLLISVAAIYALGCAAILVTGVTCDKQGIIQLVWIFVISIMANQGVHRITPQTKAVKAVKAALTSKEPQP